MRTKPRLPSNCMQPCLRFLSVTKKKKHAFPALSTILLCPSLWNVICVWLIMDHHQKQLAMLVTLSVCWGTFCHRILTASMVCMAPLGKAARCECTKGPKGLKPANNDSSLSDESRLNIMNLFEKVRNVAEGKQERKYSTIFFHMFGDCFAVRSLCDWIVCTMLNFAMLNLYWPKVAVACWLVPSVRAVWLLHSSVHVHLESRSDTVVALMPSTQTSNARTSFSLWAGVLLSDPLPAAFVTRIGGSPVI